jgi:sodium/bile acid cotransporter 7
MHGAKLSREAIVAGGSHWRLHLWVMCSTFVVFPVLGVLFAWWAPINVDPALYTGFIYLCILPATVQSAIAFTSLAGVTSRRPSARHRLQVCWGYLFRRYWSVC